MHLNVVDCGGRRLNTCKRRDGLKNRCSNIVDGVHVDFVRIFMHVIDVVYAIIFDHGVGLRPLRHVYAFSKAAERHVLQK